jgi:glycosyltransferase involved in cell wall biosynthesis
MTKKILFIFPSNFLHRNNGSANAAYIPLKMLKSLGFSIDLFSFNEIDNFGDFDEYNGENLIENLYLADVKSNAFFNKLKRKIKKILCSYYPDSFMYDTVLKKFKEVIKNTNYDYIYVHYINWVDLFRNIKIPPATKLIYNMHDSDFVQHIYNRGICKSGNRFEQEFNALSVFNRVICVSFDEMLFWSKFYPNKEFFFFPPVNPLKDLNVTGGGALDVLLLGAYNPHNIKGAEWFLDKVLPHLPQNISITFCGKFLTGLSTEHREKVVQRSINSIDFADDIEALYARTKVVIVPILGGTGIKIKILEALSYSIPVVSTLLGVDGLPDKYENGCLVADQPVEFAEYIKRLLEDEDFYCSVKEKSKNYFNKYISYERNMKVLEKCFGD